MRASQNHSRSVRSRTSSSSQTASKMQGALVEHDAFGAFRHGGVGQFGPRRQALLGEIPQHTRRPDDGDVLRLGRQRHLDADREDGLGPRMVSARPHGASSPARRDWGGGQTGSASSPARRERVATTGPRVASTRDSKRPNEESQAAPRRSWSPLNSSPRSAR